jgi:hypothetical protein
MKAEIRKQKAEMAGEVTPAFCFLLSDLKRGGA